MMMMMMKIFARRFNSLCICTLTFTSYIIRFLLRLLLLCCFVLFLCVLSSLTVFASSLKSRGLVKATSLWGTISHLTVGYRKPPHCGVPQATSLWGTTDAEIKLYSAGNTKLSKRLSFKSETGQITALHASHTARNYELLFSLRSVHSTLFPPILFKRKVPFVMNSKGDNYLWFDDSSFAPYDRRG